MWGPHACAVMPWGGGLYFRLGVGGCNYDASTIQNLKPNNIWTFLTRKNNKGNHFQLSSQELPLELTKLGKTLYVSVL
jgi:hypothetical protein